MFDIKEILVVLGLTLSPVVGSQDILFYKQKLKSEITQDKKIQAELKQLEFKKMWEDVNTSDFADRWLKGKKASDKIQKLKSQQEQSRNRIRVLKQIIEKDSLERIKIEPISL